ncbi:MAG: crotonase/enoyl-CoA hydratase family protein [Pseudomonadota bacterium]
MSLADTVTTTIENETFLVGINRPEIRNAVDRPTADALADAMAAFDGNEDLKIAILYGVGEHFCAGADLKAIALGSGNRIENISKTDLKNGPMGPTRMTLSKPVIAAVEGYAVAGGLELALWCDLRVAAENATFGVFCRRFGVPLIDGGTVRLPRLIGQSRAMDMILTGRPIAGPEAHQIGLANRLVPDGEALNAAKALAKELCALPQTCMRHDRASSLAQWGLSEIDALSVEFDFGRKTLESGETLDGATTFNDGAGRSGKSLNSD